MKPKMKKKNRLKCSLFFMVFFMSLSGMAQEPRATMRGTVLDEKANALSGATVLVSETNAKDTIRILSDDRGHFVIQTLRVGRRYDISVRNVGYQDYQRKSFEIGEGENNSLLVRMLPQANNLEEVTVSYGRQQKAKVTGSLVSLDAAPLQDMPVMQFGQQLQGKVSGLQIIQNSGQPGRGIDFRLRGSASLSSGYTPLYVIDGMPITGSINNINPNEIETFTVLKDASASALYGSRASNGVILITTKHAKIGDPIISFNGFYGIQSIPSRGVPKMMNAREFAEFQNEYYEDRVKYEGYTGTLDPVYANPERYGEGTNWWKLLTRTAPIQNYDLTYSAASEKSSSTFMASYQNQQGVIINNGTQLFSLRMNQEFYFLDKKIKAGINFAPSYRLDHNNRLGTDGVNNLIEKIVEASPLIAAVNEDGTMPLYVNSPGMVSNVNPYAQYIKTKDDYKTSRLLGNTYFNYEFLRGLTLNTNAGVDMGMETRNYFQPSSVRTDGKATGTSTSVSNYSYTAEANLDYKKTLNGEHHLEALAGYSVQKFKQENNSVAGTDFTSDDIPRLSEANSITSGSSNTTQYSLLSAIARLNYDYKGTYLFQGSIRRDGSSRFGADRKYGSFPSVSAGWVISNEPFMHKIKAVNFLKLRASYGITGNNNIGNFTHISSIGSYNYVFNNQLVAGSTISSIGNAELAWERNKQFDIGLDVSFLDNRLSFTYDYYHKTTDGLIQDRPIPQASGFTSITSNVGVLSFWGHEFGVKANILTGTFKWNTDFNMSFDRNIIKSLVSPGFIRRNNTVSSDYWRNQEGHHLGEFFGFVFEGLYKDEADLANSAKYANAAVGTIKMKDVNEDGIIDNDDRTFIGNPNPNFIFGMTHNFQYKNFDLSISMNGSQGGKILTPAKYPYMANLDGARNILAAAKDRWRSPENPGAGVYPRTLTGTTVWGRNVNSQWVENGSYINFNNITLGYTLPFLKPSSPFKSLRVYASVQRVFYITGYSGMNPEISLDGLNGGSIGIDENAYPVPRTISFGISTTLK